MRASRRFAILAAGSALGAAPLAAGAQALPPPPYQTADQAGAPALQESPQTMDRYGGGSRRSYPAPIQLGDPYGAQAVRSGPRLAWAGKVETVVQSPAPAQTGGWSAMARQWDAPPPAQAPAPIRISMQAAQMAPPVNPWRPLYPQGAYAPQPAPTSIYDAPPPPAAAPALRPYRQASAAPAPNGQGGPRFYSLHREYGIQPDPIPLPPQFFGPTADLSASVAEPLAKRTTVVNGQTKTVNVPDDQGAQ